VTSRRRPSAFMMLAGAIGVLSFLYPFLLPIFVAGRGAEMTATHDAGAPLIFAAITAISLLAIVAELGDAQFSSAKMVALLGVLVAIDAILRLVPTFLGASPIFLLIVLVGFVFGPSLGFQMGALTLLLSAFLTGGLGPWLPYQMLGSGWIGMTAGWLPQPRSAHRRLFMIAGFSAVWGFLYGLLLSLTVWPFTAPGLETAPGLAWTPALSAGEAVHRYIQFYLVTSLGHDAFRAVGNAVLVLVVGAPVLHVLERFHSRFSWEPWVAEPEAPPAQSAEQLKGPAP
jgi:energy-coupling factor transport system substrate-specific component